MNAMDELYQKVAAGSYDEAELRTRVGALKRRIRDARTGTADERQVALKVASALPLSDRTEMLGMYLGDEFAEIRSHALNLAIELKADGMRVVREACLVSHPDVAVRAIELLTRGVDKTATSRVQRLLTSGSPQVRAAAARFLGHASGPGVIPRLTRLLADPSRQVSHAAELGIDRLKGELPKRPSMNWWEATPLEDEAPQDDDDDMPVLLDNFEPPPPPPMPLGGPGGLGELGSLMALAPLAPPDAPKPVQQDLTDWEPASPALLPSPLPTETYALAKGLSHVAATDRAALLGPLSQASDARVAIDRLARSTEAADRAAAALAVGGLKINARVALLTRLFRDKDDTVRAAAAAAMAPIAGASALAQLSRLLTDPSPQVRRAGALALARAAVRLDQAGFALNAIKRLDDEPDPEVAEAAQTARRLLGG